MPSRVTEKTRRRWPLYHHRLDASIRYRARKALSVSEAGYEVATPDGDEVGFVAADLFEATYQRLYPRRKTGG